MNEKLKYKHWLDNYKEKILELAPLYSYSELTNKVSEEIGIVIDDPHTLFDYFKAIGYKKPQAPRKPKYTNRGAGIQTGRQAKCSIGRFR